MSIRKSSQVPTLIFRSGDKMVSSKPVKWAGLIEHIVLCALNHLKRSNVYIYIFFMDQS